MADTQADTSVKVAVRVRPLVPKEINKGCKAIVEVIPQNEQVVIKSCDKAFTFNYVLGTDCQEDELYNRCVKPLLKNLFAGINVTIFAYGQTGSGKTYSMGTSYNGEGNMGVIPKAINEIFDYIREQFLLDFTVTVSFTELYREVLYDLLANKSRDQCSLEIREDNNKEIYIPNLTEIAVEYAGDVFNILFKGSEGRATASTNMNAHSSRSHSIFTMNFAMQHKIDKSLNKTAKLHLVDLAGSERPKKTGAQGMTFKEGIDINKGLFVLGNVISALGEEKGQNKFIPYRDSNLTRLLKDSLGGNSVTLMIACISPADYNLEETISTLRYADKARKIKNKPVVNEDPKTAKINELKRQVKQLQLQIVGQGGPALSVIEIDQLKVENNELNLKIKNLMAQLSAALLDKTGLHEKLLILQNANNTLNKKLLELKNQFNATFSRISMGMENNNLQVIKDNLKELQGMQEHFEVLQNDQIKTENEIRTHEETFTMLASTTRSSTGSTPEEIQEKAESHTTRQMVLNSELQDIDMKLVLKEQLARQLVTNTRYMVDEQAMVETEKKIESLEKEKDELLQQLRNVKMHEHSNKIAEQRRKRVQDLEEQLKDLKKKVTEQSRLIKLKEKDEQKIKKLNQEIIAMKSKKVKLVKEMREESERFRKWKQQKECELARIKQQDRKKQNEIVKMKVTHEKQKNVLKRKFEEAAALNKRLQNTLSKRKRVQETRFTGKIEKVGTWLKEELDIYVNLVEAEATLTGLLEDRATLQQHLDQLKNDPNTAESDIKTIEEDIDLRSVQIQDLQQKLLDSDEENKSKNRFDAIQSMVEAKYALRTLFEQSAEYYKDKVQIKREMSELQDYQRELLEKNEKMAKEMATLEDHFAEQMALQEKANQEKVGILLKQMRGIKNEDVSPESELHQRCQIQSERIEHQESIIEEQARIINGLQKTLADIEQASLSVKTPIQFTGEKSKLKKNPSFEQLDAKEVSEMLGENEESFIHDDDLENDPDWRNTPLCKRILHEKKSYSRLLRASQLPNTSRLLIPGGSKRSSEGGCTCKTNCTIRCGCRKTSKSCNSFCKCSESTCQNRENNHSMEGFQDSSSSSISNNSTDENLKKPRVEENDAPKFRKLPRTKRLFGLNIDQED